MTSEELRQELAKYPADTEVRITAPRYDLEDGVVDEVRADTQETVIVLEVTF